MADVSTQHVLVLDDDDDFCELVAELLQDVGAACVVARSLAELVLRREEALACDIAILDINLGPSQPSGLDALHWLRDQRFAGRIVFLTGHARTHPLLADEAARTGIEALQKPVDAATLVALVGRGHRASASAKGG